MLLEIIIHFYRQSHATLNPGHLWTGQSDIKFLRSIGAWKKNRDTEASGLTVGGLLMFGTFQSIQAVFPNYQLDYQERPEANIESRWADSITLDGTWSGNLYDFYRKVYPKLQMTSAKLILLARSIIRNEPQRSTFRRAPPPHHQERAITCRMPLRECKPGGQADALSRVAEQNEALADSWSGITSGSNPRIK